MFLSVMERPLRELFTETTKIVLIISAVIFVIGVIIAVWRMVAFFNSGNQYLKQQKRREEARANET